MNGGANCDAITAHARTALSRGRPAASPGVIYRSSTPAKAVGAAHVREYGATARSSSERRGPRAAAQRSQVWLHQTEDLRRLTVPTLFMPAAGDSDILPADADLMWNAIAAPDRTRHDLQGADHYLRPTARRRSKQHPRAELLEVMTGWLRARFGGG